jgi:tRNA-modifying protein YgfZ
MQAAPAPQGGWSAIVSMQISAADEALTAGSPQGQALHIQPLPYALLEDI